MPLVTVFSLPPDADTYAMHGVFAAGAWAESASLPGFGVEVEELFAAGQGEPD